MDILDSFFTRKTREEMECKLFRITVNSDHVIISFFANPFLSPVSIFYGIRNETSAALRKEYAEIANSRAIWGRALLISTSDIDKEMLKQFLLENKRKLNTKGKLMDSSDVEESREETADPQFGKKGGITYEEEM